MLAPFIFASDFKQFYCQYNETSYVKKLKLDMLTAVADESNTYEIAAKTFKNQRLRQNSYVLEGLVENWDNKHSAEVCLHLLTAVMKCFFKRPPETQNSLGDAIAPEFLCSFCVIIYKNV